jgi:hypothetical protein
LNVLLYLALHCFVIIFLVPVHAPKFFNCPLPPLTPSHTHTHTHTPHTHTRHTHIHTHIHTHHTHTHRTHTTHTHTHDLDTAAIPTFLRPSYMEGFCHLNTKSPIFGLVQSMFRPVMEATNTSNHCI